MIILKLYAEGIPTDALEFTCTGPVESGEVTIAKRDTDDSDDYDTNETQCLAIKMLALTEVIFKYCDDHDATKHAGNCEDDYRSVSRRDSCCIMTLTKSHRH